MTSNEDNAIKFQLERLMARFDKKFEACLLFRYVVEKTLAGETKDLTERLIAKKVYGETLLPGDQKSSKVRTHASNLRSALSQYYFDEGCNDNVIISIPQGGYVPKFVFRLDSARLAKQSDKELPKEPNEVIEKVLINSTPMRMRVYIIAECVTIANALNIEPALRQSCGDPTLTLIQLRMGSIMVEFECWPSGFDRLSDSWKSGELSLALGWPVQDIRRAGVVDAELQEHRVLTLQNCASPIADVSQCNRSALFLSLVYENNSPLGPIDGLVIDVHLLVSEDARKWETEVHLQITGRSTGNADTFMLIGDTAREPEARFLRAEFRLIDPTGESNEVEVALSLDKIRTPVNESATITLRARYAFTAKQMRRLLVARPRPRSSLYLIAFDSALTKLAELDLECSRVVELRCFGGYTILEMAAILGMKSEDVRSTWEFGMKWLLQRLKGSQLLEEWYKVSIDIPIPIATFAMNRFGRI